MYFHNSIHKGKTQLCMKGNVIMEKRKELREEIRGLRRNEKEADKKKKKIKKEIIEMIMKCDSLPILFWIRNFMVDAIQHWK